MTIAGRPLCLYFVTFALGSISITFLETAFARDFDTKTTILTTIAGILIIVDVFLIRRWAQNPHNKSLSLALIVTNFMIFVSGDVYSSLTLAVAFWVIQRTFGVRCCLIFTGFLMCAVPIPRLLQNEHFIEYEDIRLILFLETIIIVHFSLAWFLTALEESTEKERRYAVEAAVSMEQAESARMLHDGLGQQLVTAIVALDVAQALKSTSEQAAWSEVHNAQAVAKQALVDLRRWVRALDPPENPTPHTSDQLVAAMQSDR